MMGVGPGVYKTERGQIFYFGCINWMDVKGKVNCEREKKSLVL